MSSLELEYLQRPLRDKPSKLTITTSPFPPTPTSLDGTQRFYLLASHTPLAFLHAKREEIEEEERGREEKRHRERERSVRDKAKFSFTTHSPSPQDGFI